MPSKVVTLLPGFSFKVFSSGLTLDVIKEGIDFHLERKKRKYKGVSPSVILWGCYVVFSALYFSLIYLKFKRYLGVYNPKVVCIWNGHRLPEMAIRAAAKDFNIRIAYFENGLLPNTTTMDFSGVNAFSSLSKDPEFYRNYAKDKKTTSFKSETLSIRESHKRKKIVQTSGTDLNARYIFIPFQVDFDSQVIINSPRVNSMDKLYDLLLNAIDNINDKEIVFYIKEHPSDAHSYNSLYGKHPRINFVNENTELLIRNAVAVITLNSSVGIEASLLEKKVIILGDACYAIKEMTLPVVTHEVFIETLNFINDWNPDLELSRAFFYYLRAEYLLPGAWQSQIDSISEEHLKTFEQRLINSLVSSCAV
jgi:capsular polysaccharide export protein